MKYVLSLLINNEKIIETYDTMEQALAKIGGLKYGQSCENVLGVTWDGVIMIYDVVFRGKLNLEIRTIFNQPIPAEAKLTADTGSQEAPEEDLTVTQANTLEENSNVSTGPSLPAKPKDGEE